MNGNAAPALEGRVLLRHARAAAAGQAPAFAMLVTSTKDRLFRLAARIVGDPDEAADVLQDGYVKAYASLRAGEFREEARVETWLYQVVLSVALNARRARLRGERRAALSVRHNVDALEQAHARLHLRELFDWLRELPDEQCSVLVLKELEGLSAREVGEVLGCSEGAVEQRLVRARAALRKRSADE